MSMNHRANTILVESSSNANLGQSYTVIVYARGAVSNQTDASAENIDVHRGHGFRVGDVMMVGIDTSKITTITSKTATNLVWSGAISIAAGDLLVNLGADGLTGGTLDYDGSPMSIYSTPLDTTAVTNAEVTADATTANYGYYHKGDGAFWELIRDSTGAPLEIIAGHSALPRINVIDYGATGDGATDDSAAINAAFLSVFTEGTSGGGGTVYFPPASFFCDPSSVVNPDQGTLVVSQTCHIELDNAELTLAATAASETDGMAVTASDVSIAGVGDSLITASRSLDHGTHYSIVRFEDSAERLINCSAKGLKFALDVTGTDANLTITAIRANAVNLANGIYGFDVDGCYFTSAVANNPALADVRSVYLVNFVDTSDNTQIFLHAKVTNNEFVDCKGLGVFAFAVDHLGVNGNSFRRSNNGATSGGGAIKFSGCSNLCCVGNTMSTGSAGSGSGVTMSPAGFSAGNLENTNFSISNNTILQENDSQSAHGIYCTSAVHGVIAGNLVRSSSSVTGKIGIWLDDQDTVNPTDVLVVGNIATGWDGSESSGIRVDVGAIRARVVGNYASDNATDYNLISTTTRASSNFGELSLRLEGTTAGIIAEPGGSQGDVPLVSEINEVDVVASGNDSVTLPVAVPGQRCVVINHTANILDVYPALGDNAGPGTNSEVSVAAASILTCYAYDETHWLCTITAYAIT